MHFPAMTLADLSGVSGNGIVPQSRHELVKMIWPEFILALFLYYLFVL